MRANHDDKAAGAAVENSGFQFQATARQS